MNTRLVLTVAALALVALAPTALAADPIPEPTCIPENPTPCQIVADPIGYVTGFDPCKPNRYYTC